MFCRSPYLHSTNAPRSSGSFWNHAGSSGWACSNSPSMRPKIKYANVLYISLTIAMGRKSVVVRAFFVFGSLLEQCLFQDDGIFPVCKIWFMMPRRAVTTLSGAKCNNSATNPHSSEALFIFSRLMAPFNSCKLQFGSVKCNGRVGLLGCPWKIFSNMSAKSLAGGYCAHCRTMVCDIFCSIFHWFGMFSNCWSLEDFHARSSRRCILAMSKDNCFLIERSTACRRWARKSRNALEDSYLLHICLMLALSRNMFIRTFHWWSISCHSSVHSICARWRADNWPAQLPEMSVETLQMSIVHSAMSTSEACHWWHYRFKGSKRFTMETFLSCSIHSVSYGKHSMPAEDDIAPRHLVISSHVMSHATQPFLPSITWQNLENHASCGCKRLGRLRLICNDHCFVCVQKQANAIQVLNQRILVAQNKRYVVFSTILCNSVDKGVSILHRLRYFDKVVSPVACFGASHRAIHKDDLAKIGRGISSIDTHGCGPACCHQLGIAMARYLAWMEQQSTDTVRPRWTTTLVCHMHRSSLKFASYVAILPPERWTRRILAWNMKGPRKRGRPAYTWETALQMYSIWKRLWQLDYGGCYTWTLDANEVGFCSFHLA